LVEEVRQRFTGSEEFRRESLIRIGRFQKKYEEETFPLALFVRHLFQDRKDVLCVPNFDDTKNYDAIIKIRSGGRSTIPLYVEFTYAKKGHEDSLRREVLHDQGHVNALGRVLT
jgi:hypothetical protein